MQNLENSFAMSGHMCVLRTVHTVRMLIIAHCMHVGVDLYLN